MIPQALLDLPPLGPINVHGSLLPKYRGAAPIQRAIMAGERNRRNDDVDGRHAGHGRHAAGSLPAHPARRYGGNATPQLAALGADLLVQTLDGLAQGTLPRRKQDDSLATFAPAIQPEDGRSGGTKRRRRYAIAYGASVRVPALTRKSEDKRVKIWAAQPSHRAAASFPNPISTQYLSNGAEPGTILAIQKSPAGVARNGGRRHVGTAHRGAAGKRQAHVRRRLGARTAPYAGRNILSCLTLWMSWL